MVSPQAEGMGSIVNVLEWYFGVFHFTFVHNLLWRYSRNQSSRTLLPPQGKLNPDVISNKVPKWKLRFTECSSLSLWECKANCSDCEQKRTCFKDRLKTIGLLPWCGCGCGCQQEHQLQTRLGVQLSARTRVIQSIIHQYSIPRAGSISVGVTRFCCNWKCAWERDFNYVVCHCT